MEQLDQTDITILRILQKDSKKQLKKLRQFSTLPHPPSMKESGGWKNKGS